MKNKTQQTTGWLDNFNDSKVSLHPGFVGEGTFNGPKFNNPAWGGQFQNGGFLQPNSPKLPSGVAIPNRPDILSSELATSIGGENGEPAYLIPSFKGGKRVNALKEYQKTGEHLGGPFKTWQEADKWENEVRHPYVEKGQSIPSPYKTWGEMQMGGSMPGAVGFTYVRTAGAAPSNGPYAKKTKASAKNGKKVIEDPRGQWAHPGEVTKIPSNDITMEGVPYPVLGISDTGHKQMMYPNEHYIFDGNSVIEYPQAQNGWLSKYETQPGTPSQSDIEKRLALEKNIENQNKFNNRATVSKTEEPRSAIDKAWAIAKNPMTALEYKVKGKNIPEHFDRGPRNILEHATDIVNPVNYIDAGSKIPGNIARGELLQAGANTLSILPALSEIPGASNSIKEVGAIVNDLPKVKNIKEAIGRIGGIPLESTLPRMGIEDVKALRQVQEIGRLKSTRSSLSDQMKYALENKLPENHFQKVFGKSREEAQNLLNSGFGEQDATRSAEIRSRLNLSRSEPSRTIPTGPDSDSDIDRDFVDVSNDPVIPYYRRSINGHQPGTPEWNALDEEINRARAPRIQSYIDPISGVDRSERIRNSLNEAINNIPQDYFEIPPEDYFEIPHDPPTDWVSHLNDILRSYQEFTPRRIDQIIPKIADLPNKLIPTKNINEFVNNLIQDYPSYSGEVQQKVPLLMLGSEGSLKNISKKVNFAPEGINSGDVFTGSTNTSHSSWLPQMKQVFKYDKGSPQFLGYRPMNTMGYLSGYGYEPEEVAKYLNSELDEQIKRGVIPKNIQRPYSKGEHVVLPQYGVKEKKNGGWLDKHK